MWIVYYSVIFSMFVFSFALDENKISLTFVIDDTSSMQDDIDAVKKSASSIIDAVINSNSSNVEQFVLVTCNDPDVKFRIATTDKNAYLNALSAVDADLLQNSDCPEMCMSGIELAITKSRPGSLLYVFTDASAKDRNKHEVVKNLALKNQIQIVFGLTGECGLGPEKIYGKIAMETGGELFNIEKNELPTLLNYIKTQIKSKQAVLLSKSFPPGRHIETLKVDSRMKELSVSFSGSDPSLNVIDPKGGPAPGKVDMLKKSIYLHITETTPGTYTFELSSSTQSRLKVKADTALHFNYGFSTDKPTSLRYTATRPIPDTNSYLSVKLSSEGADNFVLDTIQILDAENNNVVDEKPILLIDETNKFYISGDTLIPPKKSFRLAIKGHDMLTKENITRISLTLIESQAKDTNDPPSKTPVVSIDGNDEIFVDNNDRVVLKCKVSGYPKPRVVWENGDGTRVRIGRTKYDLIELPYDFLSTLTLNEVKSSATYRCVARNREGQDKKSVRITRKTYFNVIKKPEDKTVELFGDAQFECKVEAFPPPEIHWYQNQNGRESEVLEDNHFSISNDRSVLSISNMHPQNVGIFMCLINNYNTNTRHKFTFNVEISGVESPEIDKSVKEIHVKDGHDVDIECKVIKGKPRPTIKWYYMDSDGAYHPIEKNKNKKILHIHVDRSLINGHRTYQCKVDNKVGANPDFHNFQLIVGYAPVIAGDMSTHISAEENDILEMPCNVQGEPKPVVEWYFNGEILNTDEHELKLNTLTKYIFHQGVKLGDSGDYTCRASNTYGDATKMISLTIFTLPTIKPPTKSLRLVHKGGNTNFKCIAHGAPKPTLSWYYFKCNDPGHPIPKNATKKGNVLILKNLDTNYEGCYMCIAKNNRGSFNITYEVQIKVLPDIRELPNNFTAVFGDLALRIPCHGVGNPKPYITWMKEIGNMPQHLPEGPHYHFEEDGTLVIKIIDYKSEGYYDCVAENSFGDKIKRTFHVTVAANPSPVHISNKKIVMGSSETLVCNVPHGKTDLVRWFKDSELVSKEPEYRITDAQTSDVGTYMCRVSNFIESISGDGVSITVNGEKPKFSDDDIPIHSTIKFEEGSSALMSCDAFGEPTPKVSWWYKNNKLSDYGDDQMEITPTMESSKLGEYKCSVENDLGEIHRTFNIKSEDCFLNTQHLRNDLIPNQPLIIQSLYGSFTWPILQSKKGYLQVQTGEELILHCPSEFKLPPKITTVTVKCDEGSLTYDKNRYEFSDLQCKKPMIPVVTRGSKTKLPCLESNSNAEFLNISYYFNKKPFNVYHVCFDTKAKAPLYAIHNIDRTLGNVEPKTARWFPNNIFNYNIDDIFDCESQYKRIYPTVRDKCCFSKRFLVNPRDVAPGLQQLATYSTLNLVPQWSSCNTQNWNIIERKVRNLAKSIKQRLTVWTGVSQEIVNYIPGAYGEQIPVPKYLWKVISLPSTKETLAIIQLNTPWITETEASLQVFCADKDVCNKVGWMASAHWKDVSRGYTFCCDVLQFQTNSNYRRVFRDTSKNLLVHNL